MLTYPTSTMRDRTRLPHAKRATLALREARRLKSATMFLALAFNSQPAF